MLVEKTGFPAAVNFATQDHCWEGFPKVRVGAPQAPAARKSSPDGEVTTMEYPRGAVTPVLASGEPLQADAGTEAANIAGTSDISTNCGRMPHKACRRVTGKSDEYL
jgi:hypothetical protein